MSLLKKATKTTKTKPKTPTFPRYPSKNNRWTFVTFSNAAFFHGFIKAACLSFHS